MNKTEREMFYNKIIQVEKLLEEYENYMMKNKKKFLRQHTILKVFCASGLIIAFGLSVFAVFNLLLGGFMSLGGFILSLFSFFIAIGIFVTVVAFSAFHLNGRELFLDKEEYLIYKNHKFAFSLIGEIRFPLDYVCSGFAKTVMYEIERGNIKEIDDIYIKCRSISFDIAKDETAGYINANRDFVFKIRNYMGIG